MKPIPPWIWMFSAAAKKYASAQVDLLRLATTGTWSGSVAAAKEAAGEPRDKDMELLILPKPRSFLDALLESKADSLAPRMQLLQLLHEAPELGPKVRAVDGLLRLRGEPVWLMEPYRVEVK